MIILTSWAFPIPNRRIRHFSYTKIEIVKLTGIKALLNILIKSVLKTARKELTKMLKAARIKFSKWIAVVLNTYNKPSMKTQILYLTLRRSRKTVGTYSNRIREAMLNDMDKI